jgi:hypothetical protein
VHSPRRYLYSTIKLKSKVSVALPDVAVIVTMWLPAGVPVEELLPPLGELPLPPQAQIANANSGTKRQRSRGVEEVEAFLKNTKLTQIANTISPVVNTMGPKRRDLAVVVMVSCTDREAVGLTCTVEDGSKLHAAPCGRPEQLKETVPPTPAPPT